MYQNPVAGTPSAEVACYIEQLTPKESFQRYGVELTDLYCLQCETSDAAKFVAEGEVYWGTKQLVVVG